MSLSEDELKQLLTATPMRPSEHFAERVLERVRQEQGAPMVEPARHGLLRWVALSLGGALGLMQSASYLFGVWVATSAG